MLLSIGETDSFSKKILESDVYMYAGIVGDFNSVHINEVEAKKSIFGNRICHGMLLGGIISTVLGTKLPGKGTIYLEQDLKFKKPVYFGDTVTAIVTVEEIVNSSKGIYKMGTIICNQKGYKVAEGKAVVMNSMLSENK